MNTAPRIDLAALDASIRRSLHVVTAMMFIALVMYIGWFWLAQSQPLSKDSQSWGQFGDFVGGILNPLVAFSAFYWLTRSVGLQKEELLETRRALEDSAQSASKQAQATEESVRVAAYTALINASVMESQAINQQLSSLADQITENKSYAARLPDGRFVKSTELEQWFASLQSQLSYHKAERTRYVNKLKMLLGISIHGTAS